MAGIYKSLKEDGIYLMQDISASSEPHKNIDHPMGTLLYTVSTMHCMTVSLAQGGLGLGTMWEEKKHWKCSTKLDSQTSRLKTSIMIFRMIIT